ncbi:LysR family transcriptional regulator [Sinomonas sp. G460-2]|uniref:LysR family transcriptional regulator n=1 Tax=Sinomonas sp. G460-2 TaxID=3393464 RepID=UPI0039F0DD1A
MTDFPMLDFRRLTLLVGVARLGSISAAAVEAGCTASSASEQLSKLEAELGTALLERSARSVRLTVAGMELAEHGRSLIAQAEAAERAVKEIAGLSGGRVRVAAYQTGAARFVIPAIATFLRRRPQVRVMFDEMEPETGLMAVAEGAADIALVNSYLGLKVPEMNGLEVVELGQDPFILAVPARFSTPSGTASLSDFADAPWISGRPDKGFQAITELAASRAGFTPDIVARADNYALMLDLVAGGLGVALIPSSAVRTKASVKAYELRESFDLARLECLVKRASDRAPATLELCELIVMRFRDTTKGAQAG